MRSSTAAFPEVTGIILIGGKSKRLGRDKVLLPFKGKPLALHMHDLFEGLFHRTLLIGHPRTELENYGVTCTPDLIPGKGILGGIYTALVFCSTPYVFVAGVDMPFLTPSLISGILNHRHDADAVIPKGPKGMEPLCAVYSTSCTSTIKRNIESGTLRIMAALDGLRIVSPEINPAAGEPDPFLNINYPEDWEDIQKNHD